MPALSSDRRVLLLVQAFEEAGQTVCRVVIEGKRVEIFLGESGDTTMRNRDEFDLVEMKK
jgi:hypothetical protein